MNNALEGFKDIKYTRAVKTSSFLSRWVMDYEEDLICRKDDWGIPFEYYIKAGDKLAPLLRLILSGFPTPQFFVRQEKSGKYVIHKDSLVLQTLIRFIRGDCGIRETPGSELVMRQDLPEHLRRKILNTPMNVIIFSCTESETDISKVMEDVNTLLKPCEG